MDYTDRDLLDLFARFDREYAAAIRDDGTFDPEFSLTYMDESGRSVPKPRPHIITPVVVESARARGCPPHILMELAGQLDLSLEHFLLTSARLVETNTAHLNISQRGASTDLVKTMEGLGAFLTSRLTKTEDGPGLTPGASAWIEITDPASEIAGTDLIDVIGNVLEADLENMFGADKDESELSRAHSHDNHGSGEGAREGEASNGDDDASGDDDDVGGDDSGGGYPKEYLIWVCPPTGTDDYYPRYSCPDTTVYTGPGLCSACGANLEQISASDIDFYLATHELMA